MSVVKAAVVLGVISSIISIVDGTKQVYHAARSVHGLPEAFREVATRLLIVQNVLGAAKQYIEEGDADEDSWKAVKYIIMACEEKTIKLHTIFQKVIAADEATLLQRYIAAVRSIGKGSRVETLMKGILEDIQLLVINHSMDAVTDAQRRELHKAIEDVTALQSSIPKHAIQDTSFPNINFGASFQTSYNYLQDQFSGTNEDEARDCMAALFLTDPRNDRERLIHMNGLRVEGTCEWIKTNVLYNSWLRSNSQLL